MKATICADGTLVVTPESELDAYALNQWALRNLARIPPPGEEPMPKMITDCSAYAGQLQIGDLPSRRRV